MNFLVPSFLFLFSQITFAKWDKDSKVLYYMLTNKAIDAKCQQDCEEEKHEKQCVNKCTHKEQILRNQIAKNKDFQKHFQEVWLTRIKETIEAIEENESIHICADKCRESKKSKKCIDSCLSEELQKNSQVCSDDTVDPEVNALPEVVKDSKEEKTKYIGLMQVVPAHTIVGKNQDTNFPYIVFNTKRKIKDGFYRISQASAGFAYDKRAKTQSLFSGNQLPIGSSYNPGTGGSIPTVGMGGNIPANNTYGLPMFGGLDNTKAPVQTNDSSFTMLQLEYVEGVELPVSKNGKITKDIHVGLSAGLNASISSIKTKSEISTIVMLPK